jgi:hypothetical protein
MSSIDDTIQTVLKIEKDHDTSKLLIRGVNYWPILRRNVYFSLVRSRHAPKKYSTYQKMLDYVFSVLRYSKLKWSNRHRLVRKKYLIFSYSTFRRNKIDGKWFDAYSDSLRIRENIVWESIHIEYPQRGIFKKPTYESTYYLNPIIVFYAKLKTRLRKSIDLKNDVLQKVITTFDSIGYHTSIRAVHHEYYEILEYSKYFSKMLAKVEPQAVFVTGYSMNLSMGLLHACKKLKIDTYEIQHGSIFPNNPIFSNWTKIQDGGYYFLPKHFLVWDKAIKEHINKTNLPSHYHEAIYYGNSYHYIYNHQMLSYSPYEERFKKRIKMESRTIILFCLGRDDIEEWVYDTIENDSNLWLLRAHPGLGNYEALSKSPNLSRLIRMEHVFFEEPYNATLSFLLRISDLLVAYNSTTILEAIEYGLPTIAIEKASKTYFRVQIDEGKTVLCLNQKDLIIAIMQNKSKKSGNIHDQHYETWVGKYQ